MDTVPSRITEPPADSSSLQGELEPLANGVSEIVIRVLPSIQSAVVEFLDYEQTEHFEAIISQGANTLKTVLADKEPRACEQFAVELQAQFESLAVDIQRFRTLNRMEAIMASSSGDTFHALNTKEREEVHALGKIFGPNWEAALQERLNRQAKTVGDTQTDNRLPPSESAPLPEIAPYLVADMCREIFKMMVTEAGYEEQFSALWT